MSYAVEVFSDIQIQHSVQFLAFQSHGQRVKCIVLASSRSESIGETKKLFLVDLFQDFHDRHLCYLVPNALNTDRAFGPISLGNRDTSGRLGPVASTLQTLMQLPQVFLQPLFIRFSALSVDTWCRKTFQLVEALSQQLDRYMMKQGGELRSLVPSCCFSHTHQPTRSVCPALCPAADVCMGVPLGHSPSLHRLRPHVHGLVRRFPRYYDCVRLLGMAFVGRTTIHLHQPSLIGSLLRDTPRSPRFRTLDFFTCLGSSTPRGKHQAHQ